MGNCTSIKKNKRFSLLSPIDLKSSPFSSPIEQRPLDSEPSNGIASGSISNPKQISLTEHCSQLPDNLLLEPRSQESDLKTKKNSNRYSQEILKTHTRLQHDKEVFWEHAKTRSKKQRIKNISTNIAEHSEYLKIESSLNNYLGEERPQTSREKLSKEPEGYYKKGPNLHEIKQVKRKCIKKQTFEEDFRNFEPIMLNSIPSGEVNMIYNCSNEEQATLWYSRKGVNEINKDKLNRVITNCASSQILENFDFAKTLDSLENKVLVCRLPFSVNISKELGLNFNIINFKVFNLFHKDSENEEKLSKGFNLFSRIIEKFPTRWTSGIIPYFIDKSLIFEVNSYNENIYNLILSCVGILEKETMIKFVSYTQKHKDYLQFSLGKTNSSSIGRHLGKNLIYLTNKAVKADVLHQIMHCLGFAHIHRKADNEDFVYLNREQVLGSNLLEENCHILIKGLEFGPFDEDSVLMYHSCENMLSYRVYYENESLSLSKSDFDKINFFYDERNNDKEDIEISQLLESMKKKVVKYESS